MKIALCTFGFAEFTVSLARALKNSVETVVMIPDGSEVTAEDIEVRTFPYRLSDTPTAKFLACSRLVSILREIAPDVIHLQGWSPLLLPYLPWLMRRSLVFSWHDPVAHSGEENWPMWLTQRILVRAATRIVVLSRAMEGEALMACPSCEPKLRVVPHGVFDYYSQGNEACPVSLHPADRFVLFFGRVSRYKGVEDLCAAFLASEHASYKLVIAGKHLYPANIPVSPDILVMNRRISDDEVRYLFRHASLVVLPYKDATQSGVLMLAYALGTPVLATRTGGIPEATIYGETAVTIPPNEAQALTNALSAALQDPLQLQEMGGRGRSYANRMFNWGLVAQQHLLLYQEALGARRTPSIESTSDREKRARPE